jgi:hypothetical protein
MVLLAQLMPSMGKILCLQIGKTENTAADALVSSLCLADDIFNK